MVEEGVLGKGRRRNEEEKVVEIEVGEGEKGCGGERRNRQW